MLGSIVTLRYCKYFSILLSSSHSTIWMEYPTTGLVCTVVNERQRKKRFTRMLKLSSKPYIKSLHVVKEREFHASAHGKPLRPN